jgi:heptosyltransferase II
VEQHADPSSRTGNNLSAERILVMRYRFIGDTILTVPFLRNLRYAYPAARIDVLVGPQSGRVLDGCPYVDELVSFDTTDFHKYDRGAGSKHSWLWWVRELRRRRYDLVFVLKRSLSAGILAWLSGARWRVGYNTQGRGLLLTHPVPWEPRVHEVESTLEVLRAAGVPVVDTHLEAFVSSEERQAILSAVPTLSEDGFRVLMHVPAAHPDKMYPLERWVLVLQALYEEFRIKPFFIGGAEDVDLYERLQALSGVAGVNLAGRLGLRESLALLSFMDLSVCVDSGPSHLAAAAGCPVVAVFGPTDPERWRPWGSGCVTVCREDLPCRACNYKKVCDNRECLTELPPAAIIEPCRQILKLGALEA